MAIRVLFMGQKWIGERCFELLLNEQDKKLTVCGAISNISDNVWWKSNSIFFYCKNNNIPFVNNSRRNHEEILELIKRTNCNMIVSVQYPWVLPSDILLAVKYNALNLHNAKLPEYQGNNACNHAILNGDIIFTSTLHWMIEKVDEGAIAFEEQIKISDDETAKSLYNKSMKSCEKLFGKLVYYLKNGITIPKIKNIGESKFYARDSIDEYRMIRDIFNKDEVDKKVRALYFPPFEPAYYHLKGKKYYILPESFYQG